MGYLLLIEDDARQVRSITRMLAPLDVQWVPSAIEALEHIRKQPDVAGVLADQHLGSFERGNEVLALLLSERPDLRAVSVLMSGAPDGARIAADVGVSFVLKPLSPDWCAEWGKRWLAAD